MVKVLTAHGAGVNQETSDGVAPLSMAASKGHVMIVRMLLDQGAHIQHRSTNGATALHIASQNGQADAVALLCERGADMGAVLTKGGFSGGTPLALACGALGLRFTTTSSSWQRTDCLLLFGC